jgi:hypothetical protein
MFLKNCWYVAAWDYELIDGKLLARTLLGELVLRCTLTLSSERYQAQAGDA